MTLKTGLISTCILITAAMLAACGGSDVGSGISSAVGGFRIVNGLPDSTGLSVSLGGSSTAITAFGAVSPNYVVATGGYTATLSSNTDTYPIAGIAIKDQLTTLFARNHRRHPWRLCRAGVADRAGYRPVPAAMGARGLCRVAEVGAAVRYLSGRPRQRHCGRHGNRAGLWHRLHRRDHCCRHLRNHRHRPQQRQQGGIRQRQQGPEPAAGRQRAPPPPMPSTSPRWMPPAAARTVRPFPCWCCRTPAKAWPCSTARTRAFLFRCIQAVPSPRLRERVAEGPGEGCVAV